jgi:long-chain acyl-CoA synthetase
MRCGYYSGDVLKIITEDLPILKPTFFPGVPRLYNRMYGSIQAKINAAAGCKGWLISNAL